MAVPVVVTFTQNTNTVSPLTLTKPANVAVGDLLLIIVGNDEASSTVQWDDSTNKPSGFTLVNTAGDTNSDAHCAAFYRVADGTEGDTIDVPSVGSNDFWGFYLRVTGAHTVTPLHLTGADVIDATPPIAITGVTTTVVNCLAFYVACYDGGDDGGFAVSGTGWSESAEEHAGTAAANASGCWGTRSMTGIQGATGTATVTPTVSDSMAGFQFAIQPGPYVDIPSLTATFVASGVEGIASLEGPLDLFFFDPTVIDEYIPPPQIFDETPLFTWQMTAGAEEGFQITEAVLNTTGLLAEATEKKYLGENPAASFATETIGGGSATLGEQAEATINPQASLTEHELLAETRESTLVLSESVIEVLSSIVSLDSAFNLAQESLDAQISSEIRDVSVIFTPDALDSLGGGIINESIEALVTLQTSLQDITLLIDENLLTLPFIPAVSEGLLLTDATAESLMFAPASLESLQVAETMVENIVLSATSEDTVVGGEVYTETPEMISIFAVGQIDGTTANEAQITEVGVVDALVDILQGIDYKEVSTAITASVDEGFIPAPVLSSGFKVRLARRFRTIKVSSRGRLRQ